MAACLQCSGALGTYCEHHNSGEEGFRIPELEYGDEEFPHWYTPPALVETLDDVGHDYNLERRDDWPANYDYNDNYGEFEGLERLFDNMAV